MYLEVRTAQAASCCCSAAGTGDPMITVITRRPMHMFAIRRSEHRFSVFRYQIGQRRTVHFRFPRADVVCVAAILGRIMRIRDVRSIRTKTLRPWSFRAPNRRRRRRVEPFRFETSPPVRIWPDAVPRKYWYKTPEIQNKLWVSYSGPVRFQSTVPFDLT